MNTTETAEPQPAPEKQPEPPQVRRAPIRRSETINAIIGALALAQGEIQNAEKGAENPFFHSRYADLASVWNACRKALTSNGLAVIQTPGQDTGGLFVETLLAHSSGEWFLGKLYITPGYTDKEEEFHELRDAQAIGSAITYARRYALASMVGVAPEDDDGNAANGRGKSDAGGAKEKRGDFPKAADPSKPGSWKDVVNHIGKADGPMRKRLGDLDDGQLNWLYKTIMAKEEARRTTADKRVLAALLLGSQERTGGADKVEGAEETVAGPEEGNEGVNRIALADNLEYLAVEKPWFHKLAKLKRWTVAASFEEITDKEAKVMLDNWDAIASAVDDEVAADKELGPTLPTK